MIKKIKSHWLVASMTLYFVVVLNLSVWRYLFKNIQVEQFTDYIFVTTLPIILFIFIFLLFSLLVWPYFTKIILIPILIVSSITNYAMFYLGIYIDSDMVRNAFQTNQREATDLITLSGILWVLFTGVLPALILLFTRIQYRTWYKEILFRLLGIGLCLLVVVGIAAISYKEYAAFGRNNHYITRLINPTNYLHAVNRYMREQRLANREFEILDPNPTHIASPADSPRVFILAVGETSRSMNFSLNGYEKLTNPQLAKQDVISFKNVSSCGTATAVSVPCVFSHLTRANYDATQVAYSENLLDIMQKAGITILWRENDDGCKGVCARVPTENMLLINNPKYCDGSSCFDAVMVDDLENYLKGIKKDTLIVLHMIGSHGPTYYKRYPDAFKKFTPTCDTAEIQKCSREAITNTYDNTIVYADYVLSSAIDILKKFPNLESGLLYFSDHGESLGENNAYLHGFPYAIAPKEQTSVPMILWRNERLRDQDKIDESCLRSVAETAVLSHDNLFHVMLGIMKVKSTLYDPQLDFISGCHIKN